MSKAWFCRRALAQHLRRESFPAAPRPISWRRQWLSIGRRGWFWRRNWFHGPWGLWLPWWERAYEFRSWQWAWFRWRQRSYGLDRLRCPYRGWLSGRCWLRYRGRWWRRPAAGENFQHRYDPEETGQPRPFPPDSAGAERRFYENGFSQRHSHAGSRNKKPILVRGWAAD
jgi:hypothetical protein